MVGTSDIGTLCLTRIMLKSMHQNYGHRPIRHSRRGVRYESASKTRGTITPKFDGERGSQIGPSNKQVLGLKQFCACNCFKGSSCCVAKGRVGCIFHFNVFFLSMQMHPSQNDGPQCRQTHHQHHVSAASRCRRVRLE